MSTPREKFLEIETELKNMLESGSMSGDYDAVDDMFKQIAKWHIKKLIGTLPSLEETYDIDSTEYSEMITDRWSEYAEGWEVVLLELG